MLSYRAVDNDNVDFNRKLHNPSLKLILTVCLQALVSLESHAGPESQLAGYERSGSGRYALTSFVARRDRGVIRQGRDYSCGAAALATLFTHQWQDPTSENEILTTLARIIPKAELSDRQSSGLTLLDLQRIAHARGYRAQGFRLTAEKLTNLKRPVIVFIEPDGYKHFAVLKAIVNDRAYLADSSKGNVSYPLYRFLNMWLRNEQSGVILAAEPRYAGTAAVPSVGSTESLAADSKALEAMRSHLPLSGLDNPILFTAQ